MDRSIHAFRLACAHHNRFRLALRLRSVRPLLIPPLTLTSHAILRATNQLAHPGLQRFTVMVLINQRRFRLPLNCSALRSAKRRKEQPRMAAD